MPTEDNPNFISVEEYLKAEKKSLLRREYVGGYTFIMSGASEAHNIICCNILAFLHGQLRGGPCRAFMSDMKVRIESANSFYYPDILVQCGPPDNDSVYKTDPVLIMEVLSPGTAAIDRREKRMAYQKIDSLSEYAIVHQKGQFVELYSKTQNNHWSLKMYSGSEDLVLSAIPEKQLVLPFSTIYEAVNPPFRVKEDEQGYLLDSSGGDLFLEEYEGDLDSADIEMAGN